MPESGLKLMQVELFLNTTTQPHTTRLWHNGVAAATKAATAAIIWLLWTSTVVVCLVLVDVVATITTQTHSLPCEAKTSRYRRKCLCYFANNNNKTPRFELDSCRPGTRASVFFCSCWGDWTNPFGARKRMCRWWLLFDTSPRAIQTHTSIHPKLSAHDNNKNNAVFMPWHAGLMQKWRPQFCKWIAADNNRVRRA